ncbi:hypothetical protein JMM81_00135 [Bacillus sp. V3B]|uniref:hypothetical protein n=1 Tax=Bacillus sp. V3B TaxID=2804915 RepID=UPI0021099EEC|nr:hypothetical protein [Bacillus sp. V3B]MCQ6273381.1 hypothetical protein [Bacillus sp. V3B]
MGICSVCNGFKELKAQCPTCGGEMLDKGRVMDYYDDYSAYMPIDQMKLEDGQYDDFKTRKCPHLVSCLQCGYEAAYLIKE